MANFGKILGDTVYIHESALHLLDSESQSLVKAAMAMLVETQLPANVYKIDPKGRAVSFLHYPLFFQEAFPALQESWCIYPDEPRKTYRSYAQSVNPPILHRKELLLDPLHPMQAELQSLTQQAEALGLFEKPQSIGFLNNWNQLLRDKGYPSKNEVPNLLQVLTQFKTLRAAFTALETYYDQAQLSEAASIRKADILVYLAMQAFCKRQPYKQLEPRLKEDIKHFFADYALAVAESRQLLQAISNPIALNEACEWASEQGLGWLEPSQSLQLHIDLVERLPALLRIYIACGLLVFGDIEEVDVIKIHIRSGKLTLMKFGDFEHVLPEMSRRIKINIKKQEEDVFEYGGEFSKPILYQKSRFMSEDQPSYAEQQCFDEQLTQLGEFDFSQYGPTPTYFFHTLARHRLEISNKQLVPASSIPSLEAACGKHFTYRDLICCGETWERTQLANLPKQPETYNALFALARQILDPVIDYFGGIRLTYGFCSAELAKEIPGRIAPALDQHASHETKRNGNPICDRLGAACDFIVEDENMLEVAEWIAENTPFDRIYYYGPNRPLHVSYSTTPAKQFVEMRPNKTGKLTPYVRKGH